MNIKKLNFAQKFSLALLLICSIWLFSGTNEKKDKIHSNEIVKELNKVRVKYSSAEKTAAEITVKGITGANIKLKMKAKTSGTVEKAFFNKGSRVKKGQIILKISEDDRRAKLAKAKAKKAQKEIEYSAAKKLARQGYNSKVRQAEALAELETAKADLEAIKLDLERTNIIAPFDGLYDHKTVEIGEFVDDNDCLVTLLKLDPLTVKINIPETLINNISLGDEGEVKLLDGRIIKSKVSYITSIADANTRSFRVDLKVPNADYKISEGITTEVKLKAKETFAHFISPSILALDKNGEIGIKIVNQNNIVEFYNINIIKHNQDGMWVSGLPINSAIITVGQDYVSEGQEVLPIDENAIAQNIEVIEE